jgi:tRNA-2-methylthio-N6-dimethylallyladenosine synthase
LKKKYFIQTFGCQMNVHDSEQIAALLTSAGHECTKNALNADYIILNTCSIREKAAQKAYSQLGRFRELKKKNPRLVIGVGGCLAQQWGEKFIKKAPYLDVVFGTRNFHRLPELIKAVETTCLPVVETAIGELPESAEALPSIPQSGQVSAYVTIMQGCDNFCAYCIVPYLRGSEESRKPDEIIAEVECLAAHGIKEVILLGQNVNSYGKGLSYETDFASILRRVSNVRGVERIRFTTSHPKDLSPELIRCYAEINGLCEHIHLPVQSGSDQMLRRMNRGYNRKEYSEKVAILREICPDISITSDMIVGFPGETDGDFQDTIDLMDEIRFDNLFSFKYSERAGTAAADFNGKVDERIKGERLQVLQALQETYTLKKNKEMEGQVVEVLVESKSKNIPGEVMGRTRTNKIVNLKGNSVLFGKTMPVIITMA